jgi:hypothetical protein
MWSMLAVDRADHAHGTAIKHVGIDLGGLYVAVAEQLLNGAQSGCATDNRCP